MLNGLRSSSVWGKNNGDTLECKLKSLRREYTHFLISDISRYMKRLIFSPSLKNLTRRSWFERSQLLSWEVAMSTYLVQVEALSVARLAGTFAKKTRRTRTSDYVVGFMQQIPSKLLDICQQRGKGMAFDVLPPS